MWINFTSTAEPPSTGAPLNTDKTSAGTIKVSTIRQRFERASGAAAILLVAHLAVAQTPKPPAGATGICKDGTYSTAVEKNGACRGHKGVQTWYVATVPSFPVPTPSTAKSEPIPTPSASTPNQPAPRPGTVATKPAPMPQATAPSRPTPTPATTTPSSPVPSPISSIPSMPAPKPGQANDIAAERARLQSAPAAPGGAPNLVWLNTSSKVYHCPGSDFYGKTKTGAYVTEADAKAQGAHPNRNKPCN